MWCPVSMPGVSCGPLLSLTGIYPMTLRGARDWPVKTGPLLRTDPRDVGCAQAMEMFHIYVELAAAGDPVEERYPGIAAHLRACGPCGDDFDGLLTALRDEAT